MAKINNYLWPYDEVLISQTESGLRFHSPWVTVAYPRPLKNEFFQRYEVIREKGPQSEADIKLMDSLLKPVAQYPLFYCLPDQTKKVDDQLSKYDLKNQTLAARWDAETILSFCKAKTHLFDGTSALSCFRYSHIKDLMIFLSSVNKKISLPDLEGAALEEGTLLFLRQNHYVTERCEEVLTPAMQLHTKAEEKVREFIKEEQGHDRLLAQSFKELGQVPGDTPVLKSLSELMNLFKQTAQENLLAFCFIIDMFERSSGAQSNPIVQALLKMGKDKAAKPIQAHANINVHGEHDNESFEILSALGLLPKDYILDALYWSQKASDKMLEFLKERQTILEKLATD